MTQALRCPSVVWSRPPSLATATLRASTLTNEIVQTMRETSAANYKEMNIMLTLINDFHNTEYRTRKSHIELFEITERLASYYRATETDKRFSRRVFAALCGVDGCCCGSAPFGERGERIED